MKNLAELRVSSNLTQKELAKILNVTDKAYWSYESGRTEPSINTLIKIADYFDVSLDYLCGRPRPYDFPSGTTKNQKQAFAMIQQLNDENTLRVISYCAGLMTNQA